MSDSFSLSLFDAAAKADAPPQPIEAESSEPQVFSVSDLNRAIKDLLEGEFRLIWLRAEISNFKNHSSGHFYFALKDAKSSIKAVMFKGHNRALRFRPADGMEVMVRGRVSVFEPRGDYQIICELLEPVGTGALQKAYDQLKTKLEAEGLFQSERKRPIPQFPRHIGIVTSPTGAAIQDMLKVLSRRFRSAQVTLVPTIVQGDQAPTQIVKAIALAVKHCDCDVLIVGRGGGSIEDLWAFNDECVARAIAACPVPVISAVGHEVDFTIADFVADLRAPTPSAAAEMVARSGVECLETLRNWSRQMRARILQKILSDRRHLELVSRGLVDPKRRLQDMVLRCDDLQVRLEQAALRYLSDCALRVQLWRQRFGDPRERIRNTQDQLALSVLRLCNLQQSRFENKKHLYMQAIAVLESLSPLKVVARGYSIVSRAPGEIIKDVAQLSPRDRLEVQFARGQAEVIVDRIAPPFDK